MYLPQFDLTSQNRRPAYSAQTKIRGNDVNSYLVPYNVTAQTVLYKLLYWIFEIVLDLQYFAFISYSENYIQEVFVHKILHIIKMSSK